jgi:hypothetical protein
MGRKKKTEETVLEQIVPKVEDAEEIKAEETIIDPVKEGMKTRQELMNMKNTELVDYQTFIGLRKVRINNSIDRGIVIERILTYQKIIRNREE